MSASSELPAATAAASRARISPLLTNGAKAGLNASGFIRQVTPGSGGGGLLRGFKIRQLPLGQTAFAGEGVEFLDFGGGE